MPSSRPVSIHLTVRRLNVASAPSDVGACASSSMKGACSSRALRQDAGLSFYLSRLLMRSRSRYLPRWIVAVLFALLLMLVTLTLAASPALADPARAFQLVTNADPGAPYDVFPPATTPLFSLSASGGAVDNGEVASFRAASPDGSHVVYTAFASLAGDTPDGGGNNTIGAGGHDVYTAVRGATGWTTQWLSTAADEPAQGSQTTNLLGVSQDGATVLLSSPIYEPNPNIHATKLVDSFGSSDPAGQAGGDDVYLGSAGAETELAGPSAPPSEHPEDTAGGLSADGSTAVWTSFEAVMPGQPDNNVDNIYERRNGVLSQVSVASDGSSPENGNSYVGQPRGESNGRGEHAVSLDGSRIVFTSTEQLAPGATDGSISQVTNIYLREGATTKLVAAGSTSSFVYYEDATPNVSHVYFVRAKREGGAPRPFAPGELYDYDVASGTTSLVSADQNGNESSDPNQYTSYVTSSSDGSHVYFVSEAPLDPADQQEPAQQHYGLFARAGGHTRYIATLPELAKYGAKGTESPVNDYECSTKYAAGRPPDPVVPEEAVCPLPVYTARASSDGGHLYFTSADALTPNAGTASCRDMLSSLSRPCYKVYGYDDQTKQLTLVSQGAGGTPYDAFFAMPQATKLPSDDLGNLKDIWAPPLGITSDGSTVFFETRAKLTPDAVDDGRFKVYESTSGVTTLLSPGSASSTSPGDAVYLDNNADGSDVFFASTDPASCQDTSGGHWRIYDARFAGSPDSCPSEAPPAPRPLVSPLLGEAPATQAAAASGNVSLLINRLAGATVKKPVTCRAKANKIKSSRKRAQALKRCPKPKAKKRSKKPGGRSKKGRR